jgi:hypothetical protein
VIRKHFTDHRFVRRQQVWRDLKRAKRRGVTMEFFVPNISLHAEPDGEFTVLATTLVPSPCLVTGPAIPGSPPPNVRLLPEAFPVQLSLLSLPKLCIQRPMLRLHRAPNLDLSGKRSLFAFVMLGMDILGTASVPIESVGPIPKKQVVVESSDWHCWVLPSSEGPTLHVAGVVFTPTPGYAVSLKASSPQGINPRELLIDVVVKELPGSTWPQMITPHSVRFQTRADYDGVLITEPDGDSVHLVVSAGQLGR